MKDGKFTPGPWEWYSSNSYRRLGKAGDYSVLLYGVTYRDGVSGIEWKNDADAHLIAAAPELYEALEECLPRIDERADFDGLYEKARAALKKARGES